MKKHTRHPDYFALLTPAFAAITFVDFLTSPQAMADLIVYEGFNYSSGSSIDGAGIDDPGGFGVRRWEDQSQNPGPNNSVAAGSLSFGNLLTSGNRLVTSSPNEAFPGSTILRRTGDLATTTISDGQKVWVSWLMRLDSSSEEEISPQTNALLLISPSGNNELLAGISSNDPSKNFGLYSNPGVNKSTVSAAPLAMNEAFFLVLEMTFYSSTDIDLSTPGIFEEEINLYINPTPGLADPDTIAAASLNTLDISRSGGNQGVSRIFRIGFLSGSTGDVWSFDELRIGSSFLDVAPVPEPSGLALLGLAAAWLSSRRRR